jgi:hypothetical protein
VYTAFRKLFVIDGVRSHAGVPLPHLSWRFCLLMVSLLLPAYLLLLAFLLALRCHWLVSHCMEIQALLSTEISTLTFFYSFVLSPFV